MLFQGFLQKLHQTILKLIFRGSLEFFSHMSKRVCDCSIQDDIRICYGDRRTRHTELELVTSEGKRRSSVTIGSILGEGRENLGTDIH